MQFLFSRTFAILFTACLLSRSSAASPPPERAPLPAALLAPAEVPSKGPTRPDRSLKFRDRPSIPFSELHFANDDLRRRAEHFHNQADSLVAKQGRADRYKDVTYSNNPWYLGGWSVVEDVRGVGLDLHGNTIDGRDIFSRLRAGGRAEAGDWSVEVTLELTADPRRDWESIGVTFRPINRKNQLPLRGLEPFHLIGRGVSVGIEEGTLRYELRVNQPRPKDADRIARLIYGTPEEFLKLASEDLETLRQQAKQELPMLLTVFDNQHVSSAEPPRPMPAFLSGGLKVETRAKVEAALNVRLDADLGILKDDYSDMHKAIQLALPREMFDGNKEQSK